jgi:hypothetical protein
MSDLTAKVIEGLRKSGFPFEMRMASLWLSSGFEVNQGTYYLDPETATPRETDIVAAMENVTSEPWIRWFCVVECKAGREAPWVLFPRHGKPLTGRERVQHAGGPRGSGGYRSRIARRLDIENLPLFNSDRAPAYGIAQVLRSGQDVPYAALMSVTNAAAAVARDMETATGDDTIDIIWPVVMTEAPLFEARLSSAGDLEVEPVSRGTIRWHHPTASRITPAIDIVHVDAAAVYVADVREAAQLILHNTETEATLALRTRQQQSKPTA